MEKQEPFDYLISIEPKLFAEYIKNETPNMIGFILSFTNSDYVAKSIYCMDDSLKVKVSIVIPQIKNINIEIANQISKVLKKNLEQYLNRKSINNDNLKLIKDSILNLGNKGKGIIDNINGIDPTLANKIMMEGNQNG